MLRPPRPSTAAAATVFNVISKSGTNQFHGSFYDYFQNDALNARDYFNRTGAKAKQRYNYFGGAIGGPILKDKLFFYFNYQQLENPNSSINTVSVPTAGHEGGLFRSCDLRNATLPLTRRTVVRH